MMNFVKHKYFKSIFTAGVIFLVSLWLRYPKVIPPFWTDEYSSASQALLYIKYGFGIFVQDQHFIEYHNILPHALIATSFLLFGKSVLAAKIPFIFLGSILPVSIFFISKKLLGNTVAVSATLFSIFSYWFITWSQQARGYPLQQLILLLFIFGFWQIIEKKERNWILPTVLLAVFGLLTHVTFFIVIIASFVFLCLTEQKLLIQIFKKKLPEILTLIGMFFLFSVLTKQTSNIIDYLITFQNQGRVNNLWYYHAFLWRTYGTIVLLAIFGILIGLKKIRILSLYLIVVIGSYLFFHTFLFGPYVSRYLLVIFPLLFILGAYALKNIGQLISRRFASLGCVGLTLFIIINGHLFTIKPRVFYSVNHTTREIALIDYDRLYSHIRTQISDQPEKVAVIDTWPDRRDWYLSDLPIGTYTFRWENDGIMKQTPYNLSQNGEKNINLRPGEKLVSNLQDLHAIIQSYPKGYLWIDDSTLPKDVLSYAEKNLKKELFLDHYQFDDNPYSIWPGTLYSWGISQ